MTQPAKPSEATLPVLILIHGATGNGQMWLPVQRHLDPGFKVLTPDLPGHGSRRNESFTMSAAVDTVVAAANSVAPARVLLAGDSLGGFTAMAAASALPPSQLAGLVLSGCTVNFSGLALLPYLLRIAILRLMFLLVGEDKIVRERVPKLLVSMGINVDDVQAIVKAGISLRVWEQAVHALRGVDYRARLAAISQPVLIVNGSKDKGMVRQEKSFIAVARDATSYRFEDCEHGVSLLRSAGFATLLNEFGLLLA